MVKVPRIVPVEADHRPSALRKIPPLRAEDPWMVRLAYTGDERRKLVTAWRDCDARSGIIVQRKEDRGGAVWSSSLDSAPDLQSDLTPARLGPPTAADLPRNRKEKAGLESLLAPLQTKTSLEMKGLVKESCTTQHSGTGSFIRCRSRRDSS